MKIFLIRHGETTGDLEERYGGDYDDHLTDRGMKQAEALADNLRNNNIERIFTSPRIRARETSQIVANNLSVPVEVVEDLRERNAYGVLTGMTKAEASERYPKEVESLIDYSSNIAGAEKYEDFKSRVINIFGELCHRPLNTIAIITHGGVVRCFTREVLKLGEFKSLGDCAIIELDMGKITSLDNAKL